MVVALLRIIVHNRPLRGFQVRLQEIVAPLKRNLEPIIPPEFSRHSQ